MEITDEMLEFYRKRYDWKFEGPFYMPEQLPKVKMEFVPRSNHEDIEVLRWHLTETMIVVDHFDKDHSSRRAFWDGKHPDYDSAVESVDPRQLIRMHTKNRGNKLNNAYLCMDMTMEGINRSNPSLASELKSLFAPAVPMSLAKFRGMELDEKIQFSKQLDRIIYSFLERLSR